MNLENEGLMKMLKDLQEKEKQQEVVGEGFSVEDKDYFQKVYNYLKVNKYDTSRLEERLKTLKMRKVDEAKYGSGSHYEESKNELAYSDELDSYHETFHIATKGIKGYRKGKAFGEGLNEGITDMLAKRIKPDYHINYNFEMIIAETLEKIYGKQVFDSYFKGSCNEFVEQFDREIMIDFLMDIDIYHNLMKEYWENYYISARREGQFGSRTEEILASFEDILYDLNDLVDEDRRQEVVELLNKRLKDPDGQTIMNVISPMNSELVDIESYFDTGRHL